MTIMDSGPNERVDVTLEMRRPLAATGRSGLAGENLAGKIDVQ